MPRKFSGLNELRAWYRDATACPDFDKEVHSSLSIAIRCGKIILAQRSTPPHVGKFSVVGGKSDKADMPYVLTLPKVRTSYDGKLKLSNFDRHALEEGREAPFETAVREFCEEIYGDKKYPDDFEYWANRFQPVRLGQVYDPKYRAWMDLSVINVDGRWRFSPSEREIGNIEELVNIDPADINPVTKIALEELRYRSENGLGFDSRKKLHEQIPKFNVPYMHTFMCGPVMAWAESDGHHPRERHLQKIDRAFHRGLIQIGYHPPIEGPVKLWLRDDGWWDLGTGEYRRSGLQVKEALERIGPQPDYRTLDRKVWRIPRFKPFQTGPYLEYNKILIRKEDSHPGSSPDAYLGMVVPAI